MSRETDELLTEGLMAGYAGSRRKYPPGFGLTREEVFRGPFRFESRKLYRSSRHAYVDQWAANRTGGGQEIVHDEDTGDFTRLYAGGTIGLEELKVLGLKKKDVTRYLKRKIGELGDQTRLHTPCSPEPDGDWQYSYRIVESLGEIPLTIGLETIAYRGTLVFAHGFLNSPVE